MEYLLHNPQGLGVILRSGTPRKTGMLVEGRATAYLRQQYLASASAVEGTGSYSREVEILHGRLNWVLTCVCGLGYDMIRAD